MNYFMSPYSYFSLRSKRSEVICAQNDKKTRFCDSDVLKNVLKFQFFSALKIKIWCAQACIFKSTTVEWCVSWLRFLCFCCI